MSKSAGLQLDSFLWICIISSALLLSTFGFIVGAFSGFGGEMIIYTVMPILATPAVLLYRYLRNGWVGGYGVWMIWVVAVLELVSASVLNIASCKASNCSLSNPFLIAAWQVGNPQIWGWFVIALFCQAQTSLVPLADPKQGQELHSN